MDADIYTLALAKLDEIEEEIGGPSIMTIIMRDLVMQDLRAKSEDVEEK